LPGGSMITKREIRAVMKKEVALPKNSGNITGS
jgi:hypothetical protein